MKCIKKEVSSKLIKYSFTDIIDNEYNYSSIVNNLLETTCFIIKCNNDIINFNLFGKIFTINIEDITDFNNVYAYVDGIDDGSIDEDYTTTLYISESLDKCLDKRYSIHLLRKVDNKFEMVNNSIIHQKVLDDGNIR